MHDKSILSGYINKSRQEKIFVSRLINSFIPEILSQYKPRIKETKNKLRFPRKSKINHYLANFKEKNQNLLKLD